MNEILHIWSASLETSLVIWAVMTMVILYLGRKQAHQVLYGAGRALYRSLRLSAYALSRLELSLVRQNLAFRSEHSLAESGLIQLVVSGLVVAVVVVAAVMHYQILDEGMILVGAWADIGVLDSIALSALVLVGLELVAGLVLMESLQQTHLLSVFSAMSQASRKASALISVLILLLVMAISIISLPSIELKLMGAVLSLGLAFAAIPFASLIYSIRVLIGNVLVAVLSILRVVFRVLASLASQASTLCRHAYDLLIVVPLGVERIVKSYLDREVEIDVPMLTRVEAEALKTRQKKGSGSHNVQDLGYLSSGKATIKSSSPKRVEPLSESTKKIIERSSLDNIDLSETMMRLPS